jgi:membrane glycosyltransferase
MLDTMTSPKHSITRFDVLLTLAGVAFAVFFGISVTADEGAPWLFTPVLVLVALTLLWRRVAPIGALCGFIAAIGLSVALFGTYTRCGLVFPI